MIELHPHDVAHGGEAVARKDGKAHFIGGAMPGEVVTGTVLEDKGSWARVTLVDVVEASDDRRDPPCPHATTCGGCQWQFAQDAVQRVWKRDIVKSQLTHLGRIDDPLVHPTVAPSDPLRYRNRMDFHVSDGALALYRERSNDPVPLDTCLIIAEPLIEVFERIGDLTGATALTIRAGLRTGDVVVLVEGDVPESLLSLDVPVVHVTPGGFRTVAGTPTLTEIVADTTFAIPPEGFFQNNTIGADALVELVSDSLEIEPHETLLDAYCGVGLFGATVGQQADRVVGIESSDRAVSFARRNLEAAGVDHNVIAGNVTSDIERLDEYWDVAVVDPPRKGLTERGVEAITSAMPRRIAYVSCDAASFARDARILSAFGYEFVEATPVDMFPQTYHVEIVGRFDRLPFDDVD